MSQEHIAQQRAAKDDAAARLLQVKAEAAASAKLATAQLDEARAQVAALEVERATHQDNIERLQRRIAAEVAKSDEVDKKTKAIQAEKDAVQAEGQKAREMHTDEISRLCDKRDLELGKIREELQTTRNRLAEEQEISRQQLEEARLREENLISDLEARVKRTLQTKDETINELRTKCSALENKAREFEFLLARQRDELLGGIVTVREEGSRRLR